MTPQEYWDIVKQTFGKPVKPTEVSTEDPALRELKADILHKVNSEHHHGGGVVTYVFHEFTPYAWVTEIRDRYKNGHIVTLEPHTQDGTMRWILRIEVH